MKNAIGNLKGITLNLYIALGKYSYFHNIDLPIQEYDISFHMIVSISFIRILQFSEYSSFASLVGLFLGILFFLMWW